MSHRLFDQTADATIANTTTETTTLGTGLGTLTLPANFFVIGRAIRFKITGIIASTLTPTLQIKLKYGATTLLDSTALALPVLTGTNPIKIEGTIVCRTTGASGTVMPEIDIELTSAIAAGAKQSLPVATGAAVTIDTTAASAIDVSLTWGAASSSNTFTSKVSLLELLN